MINSKTNEFAKQLAELINESGLPPTNVRMTLEIARDRVVELEREAIEKEKELEEERKKQKVRKTEKRRE